MAERRRSPTLEFKRYKEFTGQKLGLIDAHVPDEWRQAIMDCYGVDPESVDEL